MPLQFRIAGFLMVIVAALTMVLTPMVSAQTQTSWGAGLGLACDHCAVVVRPRRSAGAGHAF